MRTYSSVSVLGLGYIGLPTAAIIAKHGINVYGIDINPSIIDTINQGRIHIIEPGLDAIVKQVVVDGLLQASLEVRPSDVFIIAVPTPFKDNHEPDLSYIQASAQMIAPVLAKGNLVILESTSPVGTTKDLATWLCQLRPDLSFPLGGVIHPDVSITYSPERVLPGHILDELVNNDRVVGGLSNQCTRQAQDLYSIFVAGELLTTNAKTAEMVKLAENSFRDVNIAFANELSMICDKLGINVWELIKLANHHPRVDILQPGAGVGGHCVAVDPWFIVNKTPDEARLIKMARIVNNSKSDWVVDKVNGKVIEFLRDHPERSLQDIRIACFGLTFKPDIDDLRESAAVKIVNELRNTYLSQVIVVEPNLKYVPNEFNDVELVSLKNGLASDILVFLVGHKEFKFIDKSAICDKYVVDACGIYGICLKSL